MKLFVVLSLILGLNAFADNHGSNAKTAKPSAEPTQIDELIRGELAALRTYDTVIKEVSGKEKERLQAIRKNHEQNVARLSKYVAGKPDLLEDTESSGIWGAFATAWTKGAKLMGNEAALKALEQGEQHGINEYQEALEDDSVPAKLKAQIREEMLPKQKKHIETLKAFM